MPQQGPFTATGWKVVNDFSPGIHQIVSPNHPPGAAQETNTYRCHSVDGGALAPLPRVTTYHMRFYMPYVSPATTADLASEEYRIVGLHCNDPVFWGGETETGVYQNNSEFYVCWEWYDSKNGGHVNYRVERYKRDYFNTPQWETLWQVSRNLPFSNQYRPAKCEFVTQRSNNTQPLLLGPTVVAWVIHGYAQMFPDDLNEFVSSVRALPGDYALSAGVVQPDSIVAHQGRVVIFPLTLSGMGSNQIYTNSESFYWTAANDLRTLATTPVGGNDNYNVSAVFTEDPTGYQVKQSLSADELLLIKARQGAVIVRGSLDDFTTTNYPYIRGTGFSMNRGTNSPKGFVYPVDNSGVWLWSGGEFSEHITKQLQPNFWRPPAVSPAYGDTQTDNPWGWQDTQCAWWNNFVMFPNNWCWDTDYDGWWRIEDPAVVTFHRWAGDWRGLSLYGTPSGVLTGNDKAVYEYAFINKSADYSWMSHPLQDSVEREVRLRELCLVATGNGKVKVTVQSATDPIGQSVTFQINENLRPHVQVADFNVQGTHLTVRIESEALNLIDAFVEAPTVHEFRYRYQETSTYEATE